MMSVKQQNKQKREKMASVSEEVFEKIYQKIVSIDSDYLRQYRIKSQHPPFVSVSVVVELSDQEKETVKESENLNLYLKGRFASEPSLACYTVGNFYKLDFKCNEGGLVICITPWPPTGEVARNEMGMMLSFLKWEAAEKEKEAS